MKFAILSDIHGNIFALKECFKYIEQMNIDALIWCGDYITDIPCSHEVIDFMKEKSKQYKSFMIKGNREDYIIDYHNSEMKKWSMKNRGGSLLCCYHELSKEDLDFITNLPNTCTINLLGIPRIFVSHKRNYKNGSDYKYEIFGHSHKQEVFIKNDIQYINPGSIGLPLGTKGKAQFCVLEIIKNIGKIENYQIEYEIEKAILAIENNELMKVATKWGNGIIKTLQTGIDYQKLYVNETLNLARKHGLEENLDTIPIEIWHQARKNIGLE